MSDMSDALSEMREKHRSAAKYTLRISQKSGSVVVATNLNYGDAKTQSNDFNCQQSGFCRPICIMELQKN